jgi:hypothetical protein
MIEGAGAAAPCGGTHRDWAQMAPAPGAADFRGAVREDFAERSSELRLAMAAGLKAGIF